MAFFSILSVQAVRRVLVVGAAVSTVSACANIPDLGTAPQPKAPGSYATANAFNAPVSDWPSDAWWVPYGESQLTALITEALAGSPNLVIAEARMRRAQALAQQAGAVLSPQVGAAVFAGSARNSQNNGLPQGAVPEGWNDVGQAGFSLSWDLDLFGRNHALLKAATTQAEAARAEAAAARLVLATAVAGAYAELTQLYADADAAEEALRVRIESESLIGQRVRAGLEEQAALERAHAGRAMAEAELASLAEAVGLTGNAIAALLGQGPDRGHAITRPAPGAIRAFGLPENLQVDLVGRRPDVVAARLAAEAAALRIDAAKAAFYPNVNLTAFVGVESMGLDNLLESDSTVGQVGPAFSLPIFSGGRLEGSYRGARAEYDEAVAAYDQTLTQALKDVADAAVSARMLDRRLTKTREALAASEQAYELIRQRYASGVGGYLDVLTAEDALIAHRRAVADLETRSFTLDVALIRALGGGYRS